MDMRSFFLYGTPTSRQRAFLDEVLELGLRFLDGSVRNGKVLQFAENRELMEMFSEPLPVHGSDYQELLDILENKVAAYSIAQSDPRYLAFPDSGNSVAGFAADILSPFLNQNLMAVDRSAPSATFIEIQLILWLRQLIGYHAPALDELGGLKDVGGMWTSGGNMSNHAAVLVALQNSIPQVRTGGLQSLDYTPGIILARGIEHFSFMGAATALGLGAESLIWADANDDYTTDVDSVARLLADPPQGKKPFMVVCVAGNCKTTCIDDIRAMSALCRAHGVWLHVDACHGGSLLFSRTFREKLDAVELADSVSMDPHKGLFITYPSSYFLVRDSERLSNFCLFPDKVSDPNCMNLGLIMPFYGSRGFHSLKLWLLIRHLGLEGIEAAINSRQFLNARLTEMLRRTGLFVFLNDNSFYRTAFAFCPDEVFAALGRRAVTAEEKDKARALIGDYTRRFCAELYQSGELVFDILQLQDLDNRLGLGTGEKVSVMAMAVGHPFMDDAVERRIESLILELGERYRARMIEDARGLAELKFLEQDVSSPACW